MKVTLFDFQKDALHQLRNKITAARNFASSDNPQAIAFSAPIDVNAGLSSIGIVPVLLFVCFVVTLFPFFHGALRPCCGG